MKNMNSRKRVSFGSKGSMVETLIIDNIPDPSSYTEGQVRNYTILHNNNSHGNATVKNAIDHKVKVTVKDTTVSRDHKPVKATKVVHTVSPDPPPSPRPGNWPLKRSQSVDSRDNPFLPGGDLEKEAVDLLSRATIIRDQFILKDSDGRKGHADSGSPTENELPVDETVSPEVARSTSAALSNAKPKENGKVDSEDSLTPGSVKLELNETNKDKKKQKKCCTVM